MHHNELTAMIMPKVFRSSGVPEQKIHLVLSEPISDELIERIKRESWAQDVQREPAITTISIGMYAYADLTKVRDIFVELLKTWHHERSVMLDEYRLLMITCEDMRGVSCLPTKDSVRTQLLRLRMEIAIAKLTGDYAHLAQLLQQETTLELDNIEDFFPQLPAQ